MSTGEGTQKAAAKKEDESTTNNKDVARDVGPLLLPSLYRLTDGIPRKELKLMVSEAKACEELLEKELKELDHAIEAEKGVGSNKSSSSSSSNVKRSSVDLMLESEVTPPDRYFTVSSLLGRLRDDLATPLPPNSVLPELRAKNGLLQPPPKKKKTSNNNKDNNKDKDNNNSNNKDSSNKDKDNNNDASASGTDSSSSTTLEKQKQVLALNNNPEYTKEHATSSVLLALWKKMSTHRTSVVFRRPVNPKEAPGYTERILFPMDLSLIRKMIVARIIKSYKDLHTRAALICHNCVKYNGRESDYGIVTRDFEATVDEFIVAAVAAEAIKSSSSAPTPPPPPTGTSAASQNNDAKRSDPPAASPVPPTTTTTTLKTTDNKADASKTPKAPPAEKKS